MPRKREKQTQTQTHRHTDRQTQTQSHRHTDRYRRKEGRKMWTQRLWMAFTHTLAKHSGTKHPLINKSTLDAIQAWKKASAGSMRLVHGVASNTIPKATSGHCHNLATLWNRAGGQAKSPGALRDLFRTTTMSFTKRNHSTITTKIGNELVQGMSESTRKGVAIWLGICSTWVFSMVVLGGVTRLTRSGLSMTEWKFTGERPPLSESDWMAEFEKYKLSPEYKRINRSMTLDEFKFIYWMEYAHRMWGRVLGIAFGLPFMYYLARRQLPSALIRQLSVLFCLGGAQGFVGWWMVKSGLEEPALPYETPRVSPYRLAAHLTSAFIIYATLLWTTLSVAMPKTSMQMAQELNLAKECASASKLRRVLIPVTLLVSITALSGAFVAGLDAGHAYNTFPLMNGHLIPEEYFHYESLLKNTFENTAAVQFHHRVLALSTLASTTAVWALFRKQKLPAPCNALLRGLALMSWCQVGLGIMTLLNYVPVHLGSAHQAGALTLMSITTCALFYLKPLKASTAIGQMSRNVAGLNLAKQL